MRLGDRDRDPWLTCHCDPPKGAVAPARTGARQSHPYGLEIASFQGASFQDASRSRSASFDCGGGVAFRDHGWKAASAQDD